MPIWDSRRVLVENTEKPITKTSLVEDFRKIGIANGDIVVVHSSLSKIGWIVGEAPAVIDALLESVGTAGTIVMPAHSTGNGEPSNWQCPAVPESWWQTIRDETPPFRCEITPTVFVGRIPETFRKYPRAMRSYHPIVSVAALGQDAAKITESHPLKNPFSETSPWDKLYQLNAKILLLGVDHGTNTSLHYAEYKAKIPNFPQTSRGAAILENGKRVWKTWFEDDFDSEDFAQLGLDFEKANNYKPKLVGQAESRLYSMKEIVDYAIPWLQKNRKYSES